MLVFVPYFWFEGASATAAAPGQQTLMAQACLCNARSWDLRERSHNWVAWQCQPCFAHCLAIPRGGLVRTIWSLANGLESIVCSGDNVAKWRSGSTDGFTKLGGISGRDDPRYAQAFLKISFPQRYPGFRSPFNGVTGHSDTVSISQPAFHSLWANNWLT